MLDPDSHVHNREKVIGDLRGELVGPCPSGEKIDCSGEIEFEDGGEAYRAHRQASNGEEILVNDSPKVQYGVGVLYPVQSAFEGSREVIEGDEEEPIQEGASGDGEDELEIEDSGGAEGTDEGDFDLTMANSSRPCSMAISFLVDTESTDRLEVHVSGGRYTSKEIVAGDYTPDWWLRTPVSLELQVAVTELRGDGTVSIEPDAVRQEGLGHLDLRIEIISRPEKEEKRLLTVCLVNRTSDQRPLDENCFFQSHFEVIAGDAENPSIAPYPKDHSSKGRAGGDGGSASEEEKSLDLLYRKSRTYAVGHGCAADWEKPSEEARRAYRASAECMPVYETRNITPDVEITAEDGSPLELSMAALGGLEDGEVDIEILRQFVSQYESWISQQRDEIPSLEEEYHEAARRNLNRAEECADRMREGIQFISDNESARQAFRLANHAILIQQIRGGLDLRTAERVDGGVLGYSREHPQIDPEDPPEGLGTWRAFQIAFLLMSLRSTAEHGHPHRENVELIWFPTGGGKTEAYLGLIAFSVFLRYIRDPDDQGVHAIMRYTLRLLTTQQFQRASGLICAMEYLRRSRLPEVESPISIGMWLGGKTTPNTRNQAEKCLKGLRHQPGSTENKFVLTKCPWCGAEMGPVRLGKGVPNTIGYEPSSGTVRLKCPDKECEFNGGLPVHVIDEDVYEERPDLIIGTVDKFAMLAWKPKARSLFGIDENGEREASPPELIVQDELHLISGPLGSMVGLYEPLIEELCTDRRKDTPSVPKIVSSTATIRQYTEQIHGLYGRDSTTLFPPPELEEGRSFFARYAKDESGEYLPGKKYVGIHAPGLPSMQTVQVRTFSALMMAPYQMKAEEQDPWWTLMAFYNSLRELGGALSLFQADIPQRMYGLRKNRYDWEERRFIDKILELTGRISGEEVAEAISKLEVTTTDDSRNPIDACLASSIIEVGVDIDRLSLMAVVGQPKTTSQYIQVTGRVGRNWRERPGIVATLYSSSKPRDRSHFERFRSYHERLYAQVEPSSVTPFSPPALERALHAIMISYVRQTNEQEITPDETPDEVLLQLRDILEPRVREVDSEELSTFRQVFKERVEEWKKWEPDKWDIDDDSPGLMYRAGDYPGELGRTAWPVPMSMRSVDAECKLKIDIPL